VRRGDWIITYTGKSIYPLDPKQDEICIEDIAHSLSLLNRFCGHTKFPYSVAQHSIECSYVVPEKYALEALLHDASEAYMADLPRPVKYSIPEYQNLEADLLYEIAKKFNIIDTYRSPEVKDADYRMLVTEARQLCNGPSWWENPKYPLPYLSIEIEEDHWRDVESTFLQRYYEIR
jgi:hypothetical protein